MVIPNINLKLNAQQNEKINRPVYRLIMNL